jgi:hypothetical protein
MQSRDSSGSSFLLRAVRVVGWLAAVGWGWYIVAAFRTQQVGFSAAILGVALVFVLPAAVVPFLGLRWRAVALGTVITMLVALGTAEAIADLEESGFRRKCQDLPVDAAMVFQERQWPFAHHHLFYDPSTGQWGGGD